MSALLIIHRTNEGQITNIPFTYRDGHLMELIEEIADVLAGMGIAESVWEGVAADRLRTILEQRRKLAEQSEVIASMQHAVGAMAL